MSFEGKEAESCCLPHRICLGHRSQWMPHGTDKAGKTDEVVTIKCGRKKEPS